MVNWLSPGQYGADALNIGDGIDCGSITITPEMIDCFADLTGDRFQIHMSDNAANAHGFKRRVAHGLLVLSLVDGLKNQADAQFNARASLGWNWRFVAPVLAGDTICATLEVENIRKTGKTDQAILTIALKVTNNSGAMVQTGTNKLLAYR